MRFDDVGEKKKKNMFFPRSTLHLMDWVTLTSVKEDLWWFEDMFLDNGTGLLLTVWTNDNVIVFFILFYFF